MKAIQMKGAWSGRAGLVVATLGLAVAAHAAPQVLTCPASLQEQPQVREVPAPWQLGNPAGERPLERAAIFLGAGAAMLDAQVPDATERSKGREQVRWRLLRGEGDTFWLGCTYTGTSAMLVQPLAAELTRCVVTYELLATGRRSRLERVQCE
jgi:hypothetical protein